MRGQEIPGVVVYAILHRVTGEDFSDKMTFEQRPEEMRK